MNSLKRFWRAGDRHSLRENILLPYKQQYPAPYQTIFVKRNKRWLPAINKLFKTPEVELVLVGAMHLIGSDGLLKHFESRGFVVEQL